MTLGAEALRKALNRKRADNARSEFQLCARSGFWREVAAFSSAALLPAVPSQHLMN